MTKKQLSIPFIIAVLLIFIGILLRTVQYSSGRSLWLDEAMLALNIVNRTYAELIKPLDYHQGAPLGYLYLQKSAIVIFGKTDFVLRLISFVAGAASLFLVYHLSQRVVSQKAGLIALGFFSILTPLVYYASEVKPYASDVAITLLLLLVALRYLGDRSPRNIIMLAFAGLVALAMSYPAIFMMAGIGVCLLFDSILEKKIHTFLSMILILSIWLSFFLLLYFISYKLLAADHALVKPYASSFMPIPPWSDLSWYFRSFNKIIENPLALTTNKLVKNLVTGLILVGIYSQFRRDKNTVILFIVPILFVLIASGMEKYPFEGRFVLFLVPLFLLLMGEGIDCIYRAVDRYSSIVAMALTVALLVVIAAEPIKNALYTFYNPYMREHIKPVLAHISENKRDTDNVYVYYSALPAFKYYAPQYGLERNYTMGVKARQEPTNYLVDIESIDKGVRTWFLFSHNCSWCKVNEKHYFLRYLDRIGVREDAIQAPGASAFLYTLNKK